MVAKTAEKQKVKDQAQSDAPLLDLNNAAVKKLIKAAKARGYVTYDELNEVLPSDEVSSEKIEDTMAMLTEMGINVVESEEDNEDVAETAKKVEAGLPVKVAKSASEPIERTDDPVRMYLREMGSV
ncbi:MAG: RNA polymerase sigma factor region1.1 domain-containing protein, partial [Hyphomicrobiales bacterium]